MMRVTLLPVENICGLLGSILLLFAPVRDQLLRQREWFSRNRSRNVGATRKYWDIVASGYERERSSWSFWDSATMMLGAILIGASYVINSGS